MILYDFISEKICPISDLVFFRHHNSPRNPRRFFKGNEALHADFWHHQNRAKQLLFLPVSQLSEASALGNGPMEAFISGQTIYLC